MFLGGEYRTAFSFFSKLSTRVTKKLKMTLIKRLVRTHKMTSTKSYTWLNWVSMSFVKAAMKSYYNTLFIPGKKGRIKFFYGYE